jgi:hypothetical protein
MSIMNTTWAQMDYQSQRITRNGPALFLRMPGWAKSGFAACAPTPETSEHAYFANKIFISPFDA